MWNAYRTKVALCALLILCIVTFGAVASAAPKRDHWVGTWATAVFAAENTEYKFGITDTTIRQIVQVSMGGRAARVILTNEFGRDPLRIENANLAISAGGCAIDTNSAQSLTFNGSQSIVIPAGASATSDPVDLELAPNTKVAISILVPAQAIQQVTYHFFASYPSYATAGDVVASKTFEAPKELPSWFFVKGILVEADHRAASIVAFGDSITDGLNKWPDVLATRLQTNRKTANLSVLNEGIAGNRVLRSDSSHGPSGLARFDRDVIAQAGVKYVIILEGINDIGFAQNADNADSAVTAKDLIAGLSQLAIRAHTHGLKVFCATLTPYIGAFYAAPEGEQVREAVNQWIRTTDKLDGFIDFEKIVQDPARPTVLSPKYDSGDHLHPSVVGSKAMADAIDLTLFTSR